MTEEKQEVATLPKHYFSIQLDDGQAAYRKGHDPDHETHVVEYRHGNSPSFYPIKMPGLGRVGNVVMRKGIFTGDAKFWTWYNQNKLDNTRRQTVVINLLDATGAPAMICTLQNAWPNKIDAPELKSDGNEVAIEQIKIAFETMTVLVP